MLPVTLGGRQVTMKRPRGTAARAPRISTPPIRTLAKSQQAGSPCSCPGSDGNATKGVTEATQ